MTTGNRTVCRRLCGIKRGIAVLLAGGVLLLGAGCYGSFALTHVVYSFNGALAPGLLRQIAFWVFIIVPVYEVSAVADVFVLNLLEFWTGADFGGFSRLDEGDGLEVEMVSGDHGESARLIISKAGRAAAEVEFIRVSDGRCEVRSPDGLLLATAVRCAGGAIRLEDKEGDAVAILPADQVGALLASGR